MAILPTLAAAGAIAEGVGGIVQGFSAANKAKLTPAQERLLAELRRRERSGNLGLSGKERAAMENRLSAPIAAAEREGNARFNAGMTIDEAGSGAGAKAFQGEVTRRAERRLGVGQAIDEADIAKEQANKALLLQLDRQAQDAKQARRDAWIGLATGGISTLGKAAQAVGPSIMQKKQQNALAMDEYNSRKAQLEAAYGRPFSDKDARELMQMEDQYNADKW